MKNDKYPIGNFGTGIFGLLFVGSIIIIPIFFNLDENRKLNINNNNYADIKDSYVGSSYMGELRGQSKCEIYKKSKDAALTYMFSGFGIKYEFGKIKMKGINFGSFECNNGTCNYDVIIDDSTLIIKGNNWKCIMRKIYK